MKLFEFQDLGSLQDLLRLRRAAAINSVPPKSAIISANEFAQMVTKFGLAIPKSEEGKIAFKNAIDPQGNLIQKITSQGSLELKTKSEPQQQQATSAEKTIDQMASKAAKYKPYGS